MKKNYKNYTVDSFIQESKEKYDNRYNYSKVIYINIKHKIEIYCNSCSKYFWQAPYSHLNAKYGCIDCSFLGMAKTRTLPVDEFLRRAERTHGKKFDYSNIKYIDTETKIQIKCLICNTVFLQKPEAHCSGNGCENCRVINKRKKHNEFIEQAKLLHNDKYDYSLSNYVTADIKICIKCNSCKLQFWQTPHIHLGNNGRGCVNCANIRKTKSQQQFINELKSIHGDKYNYNYIEYSNCETKVKIQCNSCKLVFWRTPSSLIKSKGCPTCVRKNYSSSRPENEWLDSYNIPSKYRQYKITIKNKTVMVDGFDPKTNTIYEFFGDYWHGNPKVFNSNDVNKNNKISFGELYTKTIERNTLLEEAGFNLIFIWEDAWKISKYP